MCLLISYNFKVKRYILLLEIIKRYINENNCNFEYCEILEILGKEFGVLDKIKEYLGIFYGYNTYENFTNDFSNKEDCLINSDVNDEVDAVSLYNIKDKKHIEWCDLKDYYAIRRIMIDILKERDLDVIEEKYNDYLENGKIKTKKR